MKKTLSIIMALCMVLGLCSFSVAAAPEGTAITDAAGFAAMEPNGTYYLANDITIAEPYAQSFVGTLDGNGKTVTISQPMFFDFGGTIKNLTVEGSVTSLAADAEIVLLNADGARGAVACRVNSGTEVLFENVVNNASVSAIGNLSGDDCSGAMVGKVECEGVNVKFVNCVNNGAITGTYRTAGFVGYCYGSGSNQFLDLEFCINTGNITYGRTQSNDDNVHDWCSPFIAYTNTAFTTVKYNIDLGSYTKDPNCINLNPGMTFFGCSNADVMLCDIQHNYLINKESFMYYTYASAAKNEAQRHVIDECDGILPVTLEELKSGKIAYIINEAVKSDDYGAAEGYAFYQNLGTDNLPTVDSTHGWVVLSGSNYANGDPSATEPETTEAPETEETTSAPEAEATTSAPEAEETTKEAPESANNNAQPDNTEPAKGGCGGFAAGTVAIIAIIGTALIVKKRD